MNIAIIGGSGFIGSHLIDNIYPCVSSNVLCIDKHKGDHDCNQTQLDILNKNELTEALQGVDVVFHKASLLGDPVMSMDGGCAELYIKQNIFGTQNVIDSCLSSGVKKIIFDSSVAVYGEEWDSISAKEDCFPTPRNFYGFSKVSAERLLYKAHKISDLNVVILRYPRVRRFDSRDVIYHFVNSIMSGSNIKITGNHNKIIEFIDICDVMAANLLALRQDIKFGVFNISSGDADSVFNIAKVCQDLLGKSVGIEFVDNGKDIEPIKTNMSTRQAKEILGFIPQKSLISMIKETVSHASTLI